MPPLTASATELTTAATDAVLGLFCLWICAAFWRTRTRAVWRRSVWLGVVGLLAAGSLLGTVVHGFEWTAAVRRALWIPLYLSLGLTIGLFGVAAVLDWRGERTARALLPWAIGAGVAFFALSELTGGGFGLFVGYELAAMVSALGIYGFLAAAGRLPGAGWIAGGIVLTIAAAAVQLSTLAVRIVVPFDHNGLFHIVQMAATAILARGVWLGLRGDRAAMS